MTAAELKTALAELGLSNVKFAATMGVNKVTVSKWVTGVLAVPRYVEVYLALRNVHLAQQRNRST